MFQTQRIEYLASFWTKPRQFELAACEDHGIGNVVEAFKSLGYEECDDGTQEEGKTMS